MPDPTSGGPMPDPTSDPTSGGGPFADSGRFFLLGSSELQPSTDPGASRRRLSEALLEQGGSSDAISGLHGNAGRSVIEDLLDEHGSQLAHRSTQPGHLTGSALVVDEAGERVMLMLHTKLGRWLQPGGHADGDHELAGVALREATEETGMDGLRVLVPAIDLDIHEIPERGDDAAHLHLDLRFVVVAPGNAQPVANHESRDLRWVEPSEMGELSDEVGLLRLTLRGLAAYRHYLAHI